MATICHGHTVLRPDNAQMHLYTGPSLVHMMLLSPARHRAIIWTNTDLLSIGPLEINLSEISMETNIFAQDNAFENVICKTVTILSLSQYYEVTAERNGPHKHPSKKYCSRKTSILIQICRSCKCSHKDSHYVIIFWKFWMLKFRICSCILSMAFMIKSWIKQIV